ncbi:MAG: rhodanese-like domain-containing protein [Actinobacteria bacterium]|nr:rhodanese-like domain-containing protein [Actinomycetota bacterium]MBI3686691.1 rhodanese-like domain-containing protein [Actinomycetota bacterium]
MREIDLGGFAAAHADGAFVIDVREPFEYESGHVPGAILMPMGQVGARVAELPKDGQVYVICASGGRSLSVATMLARAGVRAISVAGGTAGWIGQGRPVVRGLRERVS